jgi:glycosyltransferase involved in cell wall biosynthesis
MSPTISVIIPAHNAAAYIAATIDSVRSQTFTDWELIIIDDGSTDATAAIVSQFCQSDSRIQLVVQPNCGVSATRNRGAALARGSLLAFLDADDQWLPHKLAMHLQFMHAHPDVGISFARAEFLSQAGVPTGKVTTCALTNLHPQNFLYTNPTVTTSNVVIRRNLFQKLDGFDCNINYAEDMDLLFRCASSTTAKIEGIDSVLIRYRIHNTGLSSTLHNMEAGWLQLIQKARKLDPDLVNRHFASAHAAYLQYLARQALRLNLPTHVGLDFTNRAFRANWNFMIRQPRSLLIALAVYARYFLATAKA